MKDPKGQGNSREIREKDIKGKVLMEFSNLSFYFCERVQRRALIQVRLEAFEEDLRLGVIQTQFLNA